MSSDWWSKKLSGQPTQPQPVQRSSPPVGAPPLRFTTTHTPQHVGPPSYQGPGQQRLLDPNRAPNENITMGDAIRMWEGGEAHKKEGDFHCPDCGSGLVFSRTGKSGTTINGHPPAPRCYLCGWTGMYTQGQESNWT